MTIVSHKTHDKSLADELGIKYICRLVGYSETGDAIELVYSADNDNYEWHIGGEYIKDATDETASQFLNKEQCILPE